ncbi:MAG: hypothetical protein GEV06_21210 [Luteitalea sp.]|nr:hypothetical protein [Luteitalea sp.]
MGPGQFVPRTAANHTTYALIETFSVDWQYVDMTDSFAIVQYINTSVHRVRFFNEALSAEQSAGLTLNITNPNGNYREGAGIVSRPDKHAIPSTQCGVVPIDIVTAVGPNGSDPFTWDLAHLGINLSTGLSCACSQLPKVFEDSLILSSGLPWMVVKGGKGLYFELGQPALTLTKSAYWVSAAMYSQVPYGASLRSGNACHYTDGAPAAFLLDDGKLWPVSCPEIIAANNSQATYIPPQQYHSYGFGPPLYCVK